MARRAEKMFKLINCPLPQIKKKAAKRQLCFEGDSAVNPGKKRCESRCSSPANSTLSIGERNALLEAYDEVDLLFHKSFTPVGNSVSSNDFTGRESPRDLLDISSSFFDTPMVELNKISYEAFRMQELTEQKSHSSVVEIIPKSSGMQDSAEQTFDTANIIQDSHHMFHKSFTPVGNSVPSNDLTGRESPRDLLVISSSFFDTPMVEVNKKSSEAFRMHESTEQKSHSPVVEIIQKSSGMQDSTEQTFDTANIIQDSHHMKTLGVHLLVDYSDSEEENDETKGKEENKDKEENEDEEEKSPMKEDRRRKSRKRKRDPKNWLINIRKRCHERGEAYVNRSKKSIPEKKMRETCKPDCFYKCSINILEDERKNIHNDYYNLNMDQKKSFLLANSLVYQSKIQETKVQKKTQFFRYFLPHINNSQIRVCKVFFLNTLAISDKSVRNAHKKKKSLLVPAPDMRSNNAKPKVKEEAKNIIREHIKMYPAVESHYCRMETSKKYLDSNLNISKMYRQYEEYCKDVKDVEPCKKSLYNEIFVSEFNLDFLKPKKDRCDKCEAYRLAVKEKRCTPEIESEYKKHEESKTLMREERNLDRKSRDSNLLVVSFDLENVINLPRTEIGPAFYKKKLATYDLTAHAVQVLPDGTKKIKSYCCIWNEAMCGRAGNDIASCVYKILCRVARDFEHFKYVITWSDSCVPQNRNQMISFCAAQFLNDHKFVEMLTMKYSSPGHSGIQEVDNLHSQIEKSLRLTEVWSPISLIRLLLMVNKKNPLVVIQMQKEDFIDFHELSKKLNYQNVPFFQAKQLIFYQGRRNQIFYKTQHMQKEMTGVMLYPMFKNMSKKAKLKIFPANVSKCPRSTKKIVLPGPKMADIESLFYVMPLADKQYYINTFMAHRRKAKKQEN